MQSQQYIPLSSFSYVSDDINGIRDERHKPTSLVISKIEKEENFPLKNEEHICEIDMADGAPEDGVLQECDSNMDVDTRQSGWLQFIKQAIADCWNEFLGTTNDTDCRCQEENYTEAETQPKPNSRQPHKISFWIDESSPNNNTTSDIS
jgi:hypothetical protein